MFAEKVVRRGKSRSIYKFSLESLQVAADETMNTFLFGRNLKFWLGAQTHDEENENIRYQVNMNPVLVKQVPDEKKRTHTIRRPVIPSRPSALSPLPASPTLSTVPTR